MNEMNEIELAGPFLMGVYITDMIYMCNSTIIITKSMSYTRDVLFTKKLGFSFISVLNITFYNDIQTIDKHVLRDSNIKIKLAL